MSPRAIAAGAVPRARRREHAGGAGRDGLPHQSAAGEASSRPTTFQNAHRPGARRRHRPVPRRGAATDRRCGAAPPRARRTRGPLMHRRLAHPLAIVALAIVAGLGAVRRPAALVRAEADRRRRRRGAAAGRRAERKIKATLYYVVRRRHGADRRAARGAVRRARRSSRRARSSRRSSRRAAQPLVSAIPAGTTLRALFITDKGEAFVDLSGEVADEASGRRARRAASRSTPSSTR